jgi:hypothetical protein
MSFGWAEMSWQFAIGSRQFYQTTHCKLPTAYCQLISKSHRWSFVPKDDNLAWQFYKFPEP